MGFNEYLNEELKNFREEFLGSNAEGYENGKNFSANTMHFPRENEPFTEINSTLLIPEKLYNQFRQKVVFHQGVRAYIAYLLRKYKIHIANGLIPSYRNHTTKYQEKNQNLIRVAFRPNLDDWAELKLYRISFGMSISAFLVYLLLADFVDFGRKISYFLVAVGISISPNFGLWAKVYLSRNKHYYTTIFQWRESPD